MFRVLNFGFILKVVVFISMLFTILCYSLVELLLFKDWDVMKLLTLASFSSMFVLYVLLIPACARKLWGLILKIKKHIP